MIDVVLFVLGIGVVLWAAERLTDGVVAAAASFAVSAFFVGALVSGFEPENLVTGVVANFEGLSQVALGTVIGAAVFMLLGGFGAALLIVPMKVEIPRWGALTMVLSLLPFGWVLLNDGVVSRPEGLLLVFVCVALMVWLYRTSPILVAARTDGEFETTMKKPQTRLRALLLIVLGITGLLIGAEMVVYGATSIIQRFSVSEAFFGMTVVAIGESLEETARMVSPARRGRSDIALGNVVGTTIILLNLNLGLIALLHPISADAWVLKFHVPYLIACVLLVGAALIMAKRLGRGTGAMLIFLYLVYLVINLSHL